MKRPLALLAFFASLLIPAATTSTKSITVTSTILATKISTSVTTSTVHTTTTELVTSVKTQSSVVTSTSTLLTTSTQISRTTKFQTIYLTSTNVVASTATLTVTSTFTPSAVTVTATEYYPSTIVSSFPVTTTLTQPAVYYTSLESLTDYITVDDYFTSTYYLSVPTVTTVTTKTIPAATPAVSSLGCLTDCLQPPADYATLSGGIQLNSDDMTNEVCTAICGSLNYTFAATEYFRYCTCANSVNPASTQSDQCNTPCSGNSAEFCGGGCVANVFQLTYGATANNNAGNGTPYNQVTNHGG